MSHRRNKLSRGISRFKSHVSSLTDRVSFAKDIGFIRLNEWVLTAETGIPMDEALDDRKPKDVTPKPTEHEKVMAYAKRNKPVGVEKKIENSLYSHQFGAFKANRPMDGKPKHAYHNTLLSKVSNDKSNYDNHPANLHPDHLVKTTGKVANHAFSATGSAYGASKLGKGVGQATQDFTDGSGMDVVDDSSRLRHKKEFNGKLKVATDVTVNNPKYLDKLAHEFYQKDIDKTKQDLANLKHTKPKNEQERLDLASDKVNAKAYLKTGVMKQARQEHAMPRFKQIKHELHHNYQISYNPSASPSDRRYKYNAKEDPALGVINRIYESNQKHDYSNQCDERPCNQLREQRLSQMSNICYYEDNIGDVHNHGFEVRKQHANDVKYTQKYDKKINKYAKKHPWKDRKLSPKKPKPKEHTKPKEPSPSKSEQPDIFSDDSYRYPFRTTDTLRPFNLGEQKLHFYHDTDWFSQNGFAQSYINPLDDHSLVRTNHGRHWTYYGYSSMSYVPPFSHDYGSYGMNPLHEETILHGKHVQGSHELVFDSEHPTRMFDRMRKQSKVRAYHSYKKPKKTSKLSKQRTKNQKTMAKSHKKQRASHHRSEPEREH